MLRTCTSLTYADIRTLILIYYRASRLLLLFPKHDARAGLGTNDLYFNVTPFSTSSPQALQNRLQRPLHLPPGCIHRSEVTSKVRSAAFKRKIDGLSCCCCNTNLALRWFVVR
jgi:hypothetical protein